MQVAAGHRQLAHADRDRDADPVAAVRAHPDVANLGAQPVSGTLGVEQVQPGQDSAELLAS